MNTVLHNKYIVVKDQYITDLISDKKFLGPIPQMGLKLDFLEYTSAIRQIIYSITVKDLITTLWGLTGKLSDSSSIQDIIFLHNNLYTLGGFMISEDEGGPVNSGPLNVILNRVADRMYPDNSLESRAEVVSGSPRFSLEVNFVKTEKGDINQQQKQKDVTPAKLVKKICTRMQVNGKEEIHIMDYKQFFEDASKASGGIKLYQ